MKKRGRQTGKERFTIDASLCGRGDLLKAQGSVASYLADRLFNLSNDTDCLRHIFFLCYTRFRSININVSQEWSTCCDLELRQPVQDLA